LVFGDSLQLSLCSLALDRLDTITLLTHTCSSWYAIHGYLGRVVGFISTSGQWSEEQCWDLLPSLLVRNYHYCWVLLVLLHCSPLLLVVTSVGPGAAIPNELGILKY